MYTHDDTGPKNLALRRCRLRKYELCPSEASLPAWSVTTLLHRHSHTHTHPPTPVLMCYGKGPISALGDLSCVSTDSGTMLPAAQGWNLGEEYCFDVGLGHSCPNRPATPKGRGHPRKQRVSLCGFSTPHQEAQRIKIQRAQKQKRTTVHSVHTAQWMYFKF